MQHRIFLPVRMLFSVVLLFGICWLLYSYIYDEDNITHIAGYYYTSSLNNGTALHLYENGFVPVSEPLLEQVYGTQINAKLLIARAGTDMYFLYPLRARSLSEATAQRRGPYSKQELHQTLKQLSGDTVLYEVGPF